jgi:hypothetical protein
MPTDLSRDIGSRLRKLNWPTIENELDQYGCASVSRLLSSDECDSLRSLYGDGTRFRSRINMASHGYGRGEYKYFAYPLPGLIHALRAQLYPYLVPVANNWNEAMRSEVRYPSTHDDFVRRCHDAGQLRPTPLMLSYAEGDFNCLHQDLYGEHVFPLQIAILLSEPVGDFTGGEFVITEQRPRMQSRVQVVPLQKGDACLFAVNHRPVHGSRGHYRVNMRHGVSRVRSGARMTLGIIMHDAQ